ncbi:MAG: hypothetical protein CMO40_01090 [Verrucomicrobiaceae bacterium]|nr:hypothetical protein [Verrucomicrobiaceae bacterium]
MRLGALILVFLLLSLLTTVGVLGYAFFSDQRNLALGGLGGIFFTLLLFLIYKIFSSSAHCPLCRGPVLGGTRAQFHRYAKRTLGSHRLRVARDIIFTNTFVCPHCNESTRCVVKERNPRA